MIRDAAEELFLVNGYSGTPVTAVAKHAGVAEKTIYNLFDTKSGLLLDLFSTRVAGGRDVSLASQHEMVEELVNAEEIVDQFCRINQEVAERVLPLLRVVIEASAVDSDVAERLAAQEEFRKRDQEYLIDVLNSKGHLRKDRSRNALSRAVWLAAAPELVIKAQDAGWTLDDHRSWLRQVLLALLTPP